jgi:DNA uptake protein ComE-like DNA-binding protein
MSEQRLRRSKLISNEQVARALDETAALLEVQDASLFRVQAYRRAGATVRAQAQSVQSLLEEGGLAALETLPGIGRALASAISELVHRTAWFAGAAARRISPEDLFSTIPGMGHVLAQRIHEQLDIDTLEELELAAHDGRVATVPGFGARRIERAAGAARRASQLVAAAARKLGDADALALPLDLFHKPERPTVAQLLSVDSEYRRKAKAGQLHRIAPKRFNPSGAAWLPVLHTDRGDWSFQAMFSNTARAHRLGRTDDWVVIYFERDGSEDQGTVVTEKRGELAGKRVVRGRESECLSRSKAGGRARARNGLRCRNRLRSWPPYKASPGT